MKPVERWFFALGCGYGFLGVALGAFGAHGLRQALAAQALAVFETGVRYQLVHALALLATAWACTRWPGRLARAAGWFFAAGVLLFSGSLYALSTVGLRAIGFVTPFGGAMLLLGWLCLGVAAWRGGDAPA